MEPDRHQHQARQLRVRAQAVGGRKGYGPGIQSWYNQFLTVDPVDPADPQHLYLGLEEVYETTDGGATWKTVGPYWNFNFSCWADGYTNFDPSVYKTPTVGCNSTTHPDQHSAAFGITDGRPYFYAGNDGGIYRRPAIGSTDSQGHATDWQNLNDGSIDALQYYGIGIGATDPTTIANLPDQGSQNYPTQGPGTVNPS